MRPPKDICYMDHAATTPMHPSVVQAMLPWLTDHYGNAASPHVLGERSREAVETARAQVATLINAPPEDIYFTSSGTEADNWALKGAVLAAKAGPSRVITSAIEHHAVLGACYDLALQGIHVAYLPVDPWGRAAPEALDSIIDHETLLVSVMHANNEVGTVEPVEAIAQVAHSAGALFHTDAVQTAGKAPIDVQTIACDLLSISGHKFNGPKGVAALYVRKGTHIRPLIHGGEQERGLRGGTHNVPGIVGMGKAAEIAKDTLPDEAQRLAQLRDQLESGLLNRLSYIRIVGHPSLRLPGTLSVCVADADAESMVLALSRRGICVSSGSACSSGSLEPSHVLRAMGIPDEEALGALRFSLGAGNTEADVQRVLDVLPAVVDNIRSATRRVP